MKLISIVLEFIEARRRSTPKIVLLADHDARTISVPAKGSKRATVAVEDVCLSVPGESFAQPVQSSIGAVDDSIDDAIGNPFSKGSCRQ